MLKFSREEALHVVKTAASARKEARFIDAANRLLKKLPDEKRAALLKAAGMEKSGFLISGTAALALLAKAAPYLIPAAIGGGLTWWGMSEDDKAREQMQQQATQELGEMKKLREQAANEMHKRLSQFDTVSQGMAAQPAPRAAVAQPASLQQRIIDYIKSMKEGDIERAFQSTTQAQPQSQWQPPDFMSGQTLSPKFKGFMQSLEQRKPPSIKLPGIEPPPAPEMPKMSSLRKEAFVGNAAKALFPYLLKQLGRGGKFVLKKTLKDTTRAAAKRGIQRGSRYMMRPVGYAGGGAKTLFGKLLEKMPGETLKRYGKGVAAQGARTLADPVRAGRVGSVAAGRALRGVGSLATTGIGLSGLHGLGREAVETIKGEEMAGPEALNPYYAGLSSDQLGDAGELLDWIERVRGGEVQ